MMIYPLRFLFNFFKLKEFSIFLARYFEGLFRYIFFISFALYFLSFTQLQAAPPKAHYDLPKLVAIQNRPYFLNKDLSFQMNVLPSDPFNKGFATGFSYTHYFKNYFGWEIINFNYNFNVETDLKSDLNALDLDVVTEGSNHSNGIKGQLDYLDYYVATSLVYTPIYSKNLLFNKTIIHGDINFTIGGGVAALHEAGVKPLVTAGVFFRFFSRPSRSWKFDFRNNIYFDDRTGPINAWSFGVAYSMQLGADPRQLKN